MACPTCSAMMQNIGTDAVRQFWCPRCGTITGPFAYGEAQAPKLVERCRTMALQMGVDDLCNARELRVFWRRLGIAEAINLPANRPS